MKGFVFFTIIYIVNSIQITSTASITSIPINKVNPSPSSNVFYKPSVHYSLSASAKPSSKNPVITSAKPSAKPLVSVSAHPSHNATIYKIKLNENQKKIVNEDIKKIETNKNNINPQIKKNEQQKSNKFIIIFCAIIIIVFGYGIYKCIYIIINTKPKKVENQLPFHNTKLYENNNNIYQLQPHSPKSHEQCYRRISSNSNISNMESF